MLAGIVAGAFVLLAIIGVSLQKKPDKVEKVYSVGDEEAPATVPSTNPTAVDQVVVYPAPEEEVALEIVAPASLPPPVSPIVLSPTATRGPPCDLFIVNAPSLLSPPG